MSANPTGPLVIVNARAAAIGDALARLLRSQGASVTTEFYINDAGNQFEALARSFEARVKQEFGVPAALPENGYPGEYLIDLAKTYRAEGGGLDGGRVRGASASSTSAATRSRASSRDSGASCASTASSSTSGRPSSATCATQHLPERVLAELASRGLSYEQDGALWFRSSEHEEVGDDKDRVLRRSSGERDVLRVSTSPITTT